MIGIILQLNGQPMPGVSNADTTTQAASSVAGKDAGGTPNAAAAGGNAAAGAGSGTGAAAPAAAPPGGLLFVGIAQRPAEGAAPPKANQLTTPLAGQIKWPPADDPGPRTQVRYCNGYTVTDRMELHSNVISLQTTTEAGDPDSGSSTKAVTIGGQTCIIKDSGGGTLLPGPVVWAGDKSKQTPSSRVTVLNNDNRCLICTARFHLERRLRPPPYCGAAEYGRLFWMGVSMADSVSKQSSFTCLVRFRSLQVNRVPLQAGTWIR
jgi:hypothetical protein